jgi:hypothetical protein
VNDQEVLVRELRGRQFADALFGVSISRNMRRAIRVGTERPMALDDVLITWVGLDGMVTVSESPPPAGALGLRVRQWHVATSRLRWQVFLFVPLFIGDALLKRGLSPTDFHGLLATLQEAVTRLSDDERRLLDRLGDQEKCFDGTTIELIGIGLNAQDGRRLTPMIDKLVASGVLQRSEDGRLTTVV